MKDWSKVNKSTKKPLMWWYHKLMCEHYYSVGNMSKYYKHLNIMCTKYRINLYGDHIPY